MEPSCDSLCVCVRVYMCVCVCVRFREALAHVETFLDVIFFLSISRRAFRHRLGTMRGYLQVTVEVNAA